MLVLTSRQIFKVVMQPDTVGNRLKEVQDASQDFARFGEAAAIACPCDKTDTA